MYSFDVVVNNDFCLSAAPHDEKHKGIAQAKPANDPRTNLGKFNISESLYARFIYHVVVMFLLLLCV